MCSLKHIFNKLWNKFSVLEYGICACFSIPALFAFPCEKFQNDVKSVRMGMLATQVTFGLIGDKNKPSSPKNAN